MATKKQLEALARGRAIRAANIRKNKKVKCKRSKKRTGETIEEMIKRVSKHQKKQPIKNFLNKALKMGAAIGAGTLSYYGITNPKGTFNKARNFYKQYVGYYNDDINRQIAEIIHKLQNDPNDIQYVKLNQLLNKVKNTVYQNSDIGTEFNKNKWLIDDLNYGETHLNGEQSKWNEAIADDEFINSRQKLINYLYWLRDQYNRQAHPSF